MSTVIPEISLISLQNQSGSDLKILKEALNTHGFFTIIDHDIDDSLLEDNESQELSEYVEQGGSVSDLIQTTIDPQLDPSSILVPFH